jgi:hypothetical protein
MLTGRCHSWSDNEPGFHPNLELLDAAKSKEKFAISSGLC